MKVPGRVVVEQRQEEIQLRSLPTNDAGDTEGPKRSATTLEALQKQMNWPL